MTENGFILKKYKKQTISRRNYNRCRERTSSGAFRKYTTRIESRLHSLEQAARGIGLSVNADKKSSWFLNQEISSFQVTSLWNE